MSILSQKNKEVEKKYSIFLYIISIQCILNVLKIKIKFYFLSSENPLYFTS